MTQDASHTFHFSVRSRFLTLRLLGGLWHQFVRVVSACWCVCVSRRVWARARKRASLETKRGSVGMDVRVFSWTMRVCGDGVYC
jgi:hypothetical protein